MLVLQRINIKERGQSLIEVLIGLSAASVVIGAITVATISALNNAQYSKNQNLATNYAQQGIEIVRSLRDRNYSSFSQLNGNYCLARTCDKIDPVSPSGNDPCGPVSILCSQNVGGSDVQNAEIFVRKAYVDPSSDQNSSCKDTAQQTTYGTFVRVSVSWYDGKCSASNVFCHSVTLSTCLAEINPTSLQ